MKLTKILSLITAAVLLLAACKKTDAPEKAELFYDKTTLTEELCVFLDSAEPDDPVTVEIELRELDSDAEGISEVLAKEYSVSAELAEKIERAVSTGDYSEIEDQVRRYYKNTYRYYGGSSEYDENSDEARSRYVSEYRQRCDEARQYFYKCAVDEMPFGDGVYISNYENLFHITECTVTAEALCELSRHERTARITGYVNAPPEAPAELIGGITRSKMAGTLQISLTLEQSEYEYGETVRYRATVLNTGDSPATLKLKNYDSIYPNAELGFYENGVLRPDISTGYCHIFVDGEGTYGYTSSALEEDPPSDRTMEPGESLVFYMASTPHRSCDYGKAAVSEGAECSIGLTVDYISGDAAGQCAIEIPVAFAAE